MSQTGLKYRQAVCVIGEPGITRTGHLCHQYATNTPAMENRIVQTANMIKSVMQKNMTAKEIARKWSKNIINGKRDWGIHSAPGEQLRIIDEIILADGVLEQLVQERDALKAKLEKYVT